MLNLVDLVRDCKCNDNYALYAYDLSRLKSIFSQNETRTHVGLLISVHQLFPSSFYENISFNRELSCLAFNFSDNKRNIMLNELQNKLSGLDKIILSGRINVYNR